MGGDFDAVQQVGSALGAGVITTMATNPLSVVRTRLVVGTSNGKVDGGLVRTIAQIASAEGVKGFYKGLWPSVLGVSHGAIQLLAYEHIKNTVLKDREKLVGIGSLSRVSST